MLVVVVVVAVEGVVVVEVVFVLVLVQVVALTDVIPSFLENRKHCRCADVEEVCAAFANVVGVVANDEMNAHGAV